MKGLLNVKRAVFKDENKFNNIYKKYIEMREGMDQQR